MIRADLLSQNRLLKWYSAIDELLEKNRGAEDEEESIPVKVPKKKRLQ